MAHVVFACVLGPAIVTMALMSRTLPRTASSRQDVAAIALKAVTRRVNFVPWPELHDSEAGGSKPHAHICAS